MQYWDVFLKTLNKFAQNFIALLPNLVMALIIAFITHIVAVLLSRLVGTGLPRIAIRANLVLVFQKIAIVGIWFIGILIMAAILVPSVTTANVLATLGLTSVAVGFAFKSIFENFFTGIMLLLREPFSIGDLIIIDDQQGYVHHIAVLNTHLRKTDGTRVFVPNSRMYNSLVQVLTDTKLRREMITCSIDFSADIEKARSTIRKCVEECETVSKDKYIQVYAVSFSSNGVDFEVYWWTKPKPSQIRRSRDEVLTKIKKALDEANIPFTYSTPISFLNPLNSKENKEDADSD